MAELFTTEKAAAVMLLGCGPDFKHDPRISSAYVTGDAHHDLNIGRPAEPCSQEIKRHLFLGRRAVTNLDNFIVSVLKSRGITLLTKVCLAESYGFSSSQVWI